MTWLLPPVLWLMCVILITALHLFGPHVHMLPVPLNFSGLFLVLCGFALIVTAARQIRAAKTNIHTFKAPSTLLTTGLFSKTRNPIYLGFTIALLGVAIIANTPYALLAVAIFWAAAQLWYIPFEERAASTQFGQDYETYRKAVRRWL